MEAIMKEKAVIDRTVSQEICHILSQILSNTYILYVKTQNFHWNLIDLRFFSLHKAFEDQYKDLAEATDTLAERIRALHLYAPGSMREFLKQGTLKEAEYQLSGNEMLQDLIQDHEEIATQIRPKIKQLQNWGDESSAEVLIQRLKIHEKTAWMLRAHFSE